jgi:hypothetical protein
MSTDPAQERLPTTRLFESTDTKLGMSQFLWSRLLDEPRKSRRAWRMWKTRCVRGDAQRADWPLPPKTCFSSLRQNAYKN